MSGMLTVYYLSIYVRIVAFESVRHKDAGNGFKTTTRWSGKKLLIAGSGIFTMPSPLSGAEHVILL